MKDPIESNEIPFKDLKAFFKKIFIYTDGIAYTLIIPVSAFIFLQALNITGSLFYIIFAIVLGGTLIALASSYITALFIFKPVKQYIDLFLANEPVPQEIKEKGIRRAKMLPFIHSGVIMVRWMAIMGGIIAGVYFFGNPTLSDNVNMWSVFIVDTILGGIIYYFIPDYFLSKSAVSGFLEQGRDSDDYSSPMSMGTYFTFLLISLMFIITVIALAMAHNMMDRKSIAQTQDGVKTWHNTIEKHLLLNIESTAAKLETISHHIGEEKEKEDIATLLPGSPVLILEKEKNYTLKTVVGKYNGPKIFPADSLNRIVTIASFTIRYSINSDRSILLAIPVKGKNELIGTIVYLKNIVDDTIASKDLQGSDLIITDSKNRILYSLRNTTEKCGCNRSSKVSRKAIGGEIFLWYPEKKILDGLTLHTLVPIANLEEKSWEITRSSLLVMLIGLALLSFFIYRVVKLKLTPLNKTKRAISRIANGNLSQTLYVTTNDEVGEILYSISRLNKHLNRAICSIESVAQVLYSSSGSLSETSQGFSQNAQNQSAMALDVTTSITDISSKVDIISNNTDKQISQLDLLEKEMSNLSSIILKMDDSIKTMNKVTSSIQNKAEEGDRLLKEMYDTMNVITGSSQEMLGVISIINDISDQINLLSLNASIEAARAGEFGRGFAVVADEISKLADETSSSIGDIGALIHKNQNETDSGMASVTTIIESLTQVIEGVNSINSMMQDIAKDMEEQKVSNRSVNTMAGDVRQMAADINQSTNEQSISIDIVATSMDAINQISQDNAAGAEEISANIENLNTMAHDLDTSIDFFTTTDCSQFKKNNKKEQDTTVEIPEE